MAAAPRTAGGAVDLTAEAVNITKRMGIYEGLKKYRLGVDRIDFRNTDDVTEGSMVLNNKGEHPDTSEEIEIERDKFVQVMLDALNDRVAVIFNDSVCALVEENDGVTVSFKHTPARTFDLVIGCDGSHSNIRKLGSDLKVITTFFLAPIFLLV